MLAPELGSPAAPDDHCLVHHFIRTHGRRPSADELMSLRGGGAAVPPVVPPVVPTVHAATPAAVAQALRREVARLLARW